MNEYYQSYKEWENFDFPIEVLDITCEKNIYNLGPNCVITIWRDEDYKLQAKVSGFMLNPNNFDHQGESEVGNFVVLDTITGYSKDRLYEFTLEGCYVDGWSYRGIVYPGIGVPFEANLGVESFSTKLLIDDLEEATSITEWFLCGHIHVHFTKRTERKLTKKFLRQRVESETEDDISKGHSSGGSWDHFKVDIKNFHCLVAEVPKEIGPSWAKRIAIEYRSSWGFIADKEKKDALKNLVGFLFGSEMLYIGSSTFSGSTLIGQTAASPNMNGVRNYCSKPGIAPIRINTTYQWGNIEWLVNTLLPSYLSQMEALELNNILWRFFQAKELAVGINLPILSSALESLANRYLATKGVSYSYLPQKEYQKLIGAEIKSVKDKLQHIAEHEKILNKIISACHRNPAEKLYLFFEMIGLQLSNIEKDALKARNSMAHGGSNYKTLDEAKPIVLKTRAYEMLFHRTLLKVLGYDEYYIDHYLKNHPIKKITIPTGETKEAIDHPLL
jgi:hypothetical protein